MADNNETTRQAPAARQDGTERLTGKQIPIFPVSKTRARRSERCGLELSTREATEDLGCLAQQQRVRRVWGPNVTARAAVCPAPREQHLNHLSKKKFSSPL